MLKRNIQVFLLLPGLMPCFSADMYAEWGKKNISRQISTAAYWKSVMNSADLLLEHFNDVGRRVVTETMCNTEITWIFYPPLHAIIHHVLSNKWQTYRQCGLDRRFYFTISDILKAQSGLFVFLSQIFIACQLHGLRTDDVNVSVNILQGRASPSLLMSNHVRRHLINPTTYWAYSY